MPVDPDHEHDSGLWKASLSGGGAVEMTFLCAFCFGILALFFLMLFVSDVSLISFSDC